MKNNNLSAHSEQIYENLAERSATARSTNSSKTEHKLVLSAVPLTVAAATSIIPGVNVVTLITAVAFTAINFLADGTVTGTPNTTNMDDETGTEMLLSGNNSFTDWDYKETVTTYFDWDSLVCHKCVSSTPCAKTKKPWVGDPYCESWGETTEECTDIQF